MTNAQKFVQWMRAEPKMYRAYGNKSPEIVAMLEVIEAADDFLKSGQRCADLECLDESLDALPEPRSPKPKGKT